VTPALPRREARALAPDNRRTINLKNTLGLLLCLLAAALPLSASAQAPAAAQPPLSPAAFQGLLQRFVSQEYLKGFRHLGDERDFDHGHLLFDGRDKLVAILYHTQELAGDAHSGDGFGFIDPGARNWIQWVDDGRVENASRYQRRAYPSTATWDYFRVLELPALESHHTVLPKMLDPKLGIDPAKTAQWVFTRVSCSGAAPASGALGEMRVVLPSKEEVCLSLSAT
jgi:hypothetical protein